MVTCIVPGWNSSKKENSQKYTIHTFPQNIEVRRNWLQMLSKEGWIPKKYSIMCSKQFEQKCFSHRGAQRVKLSSESILTFMPVVLNGFNTKLQINIRKVSSYEYRAISSVPRTSTTNASVLNYSSRKKNKLTTDPDPPYNEDSNFVSTMPWMAEEN